MKKLTLIISISLVIILLLAGCSNPQKEQNLSATIDLPLVSLSSIDEKVNAKFYENSVNPNDYENLPELVSSESSCVMQISLADNFDSPIQLYEEYYTYNGNTGLCEPKNYDLSKDKNGVVSLTMSRRGSDRDEEGIYYLKNEQGTFVFKVILPLD